MSENPYQQQPDASQGAPYGQQPAQGDQGYGSPASPSGGQGGYDQPYGAQPGHGEPPQGQAYGQPTGQPAYGQAPQGQAYGSAPQPGYPQQGYPQPGQPYGQPGFDPNYDPQAKSRLAAGLLGILVGSLGIHRFYLGYTGIGLTMLLVSVLSFGFAAPVIAIWGLVEGILYLTSKQGYYSVDSTGRPLRA